MIGALEVDRLLDAQRSRAAASGHRSVATLGTVGALVALAMVASEQTRTMIRAFAVGLPDVVVTHLIGHQGMELDWIWPTTMATGQRIVDAHRGPQAARHPRSGRPTPDYSRRATGCSIRRLITSFMYLAPAIVRATSPIFDRCVQRSFRLSCRRIRRTRCGSSKPRGTSIARSFRTIEPSAAPTGRSSGNDCLSPPTHLASSLRQDAVRQSSSNDSNPPTGRRPTRCRARGDCGDLSRRESAAPNCQSLGPFPGTSFSRQGQSPANPSRSTHTRQPLDFLSLPSRLAKLVSTSRHIHCSREHESKSTQSERRSIKSRQPHSPGCTTSPALRRPDAQGARRNAVHSRRLQVAGSGSDTQSAA